MMAFWVRSSRMPITFQKNCWEKVVPEPWSSRTSADVESANCAEAAVAARTTTKAMDAAEIFIFLQSVRRRAECGVWGVKNYEENPSHREDCRPADLPTSAKKTIH